MFCLSYRSKAVWYPKLPETLRTLLDPPFPNPGNPAGHEGSAVVQRRRDNRSYDWRTLLDVNVFGSCIVTYQALGYLREAGEGDIVNMSSIAGRRVTGSDGAVYSGTKFAVHIINEIIRREMHGGRIRVMVVSLGWVNTELGRT